jgi:predicted deacetylase
LSLGVHIAIHDVAPPFRDDVERALELACAAGARPALLVVPDHHGRRPLGDDPTLCRLLRGLQKDGHEIFLHGLFHEAEARRAPGRPISTWLAQRVASNGEAEMHGLSREEAARRLDAGAAALGEVGLTVDGFVPPAWVLPRGLLPILAARGCPYTEDHLRVYAPSAGRSRASLVLNYASRSGLRLLSSVAYCRATTPLAELLPTRIAIHPSDMRSPLLRREVVRLLAWGKKRWVARARELLE